MVQKKKKKRGGVEEEREVIICMDSEMDDSPQIKGIKKQREWR